MPFYTRKCKDCGEVFEKLSKIEERDNFVKCPSCGGSNTPRVLESPMISYHPSRLMTHKQDPQWLEIQRNIAKKHPLSEFAKNRSV